MPLKLCAGRAVEKKSPARLFQHTLPGSPGTLMGTCLRGLAQYYEEAVLHHLLIRHVSRYAGDRCQPRTLDMPLAAEAAEAHQLPSLQGCLTTTTSNIVMQCTSFQHRQGSCSCLRPCEQHYTPTQQYHTPVQQHNTQCRTVHESRPSCSAAVTGCQTPRVRCSHQCHPPAKMVASQKQALPSDGSSFRDLLNKRLLNRILLTIHCTTGLFLTRL